jgi:outer membrane murein-binding lipoprotein Lpp
MKTLSIVILTVAVMSGVSSQAAAQELALNPPDINGKLNALVQQKMDQLMDVKQAAQDQAGARKQLTTTGEQGREISHDSFVYVVSDSRG